VIEDGGGKLGASDVILDAVRRIPREVRHQLWEPTSILFPPVEPEQFYAPVWEDFLLPSGQSAPRIDEGLRPLEVDREGQARDEFFSAFQGCSSRRARRRFFRFSGS
jgi:hypothetical protein